jgi:hypothetical protein
VVEWTWLSLYFNVIQLRSYHSSEVLINLIFARVQLIMPMRIEAGRIAALGIPQDPLRCGCFLAAAAGLARPKVAMPASAPPVPDRNARLDRMAC